MGPDSLLVDGTEPHRSRHHHGHKKIINEHYENLTATNDSDTCYCVPFVWVFKKKTTILLSTIRNNLIPREWYLFIYHTIIGLTITILRWTRKWNGCWKPTDKREKVENSVKKIPSWVKSACTKKWIVSITITIIGEQRRFGRVSRNESFVRFS